MAHITHFICISLHLIFISFNHFMACFRFHSHFATNQNNIFLQNLSFPAQCRNILRILFSVPVIFSTFIIIMHTRLLTPSSESCHATGLSDKIAETLKLCSHVHGHKKKSAHLLSLLTELQNHITGFDYNLFFIAFFHRSGNN